MHKDNLEIRSALTAAGLHQWQLAELIGVSDGTLCRYLRYKLSQQSINSLIKIIQTKDMEEGKKVRAEICRRAIFYSDIRSFEVNDFIPYEERTLAIEKSKYRTQKEFEKDYLET